MTDITSWRKFVPIHTPKQRAGSGSTNEASDEVYDPEGDESYHIPHAKGVKPRMKSRLSSYLLPHRQPKSFADGPVYPGGHSFSTGKDVTTPDPEVMMDAIFTKLVGSPNKGLSPSYNQFLLHLFEGHRRLLIADSKLRDRIDVEIKRHHATGGRLEEAKKTWTTEKFILISELERLRKLYNESPTGATFTEEVNKIIEDFKNPPVTKNLMPGDEGLSSRPDSSDSNKVSRMSMQYFDTSEYKYENLPEAFSSAMDFGLPSISQILGRDNDRIDPEEAVTFNKARFTVSEFLNGEDRKKAPARMSEESMKSQASKVSRQPPSSAEFDMALSIAQWLAKKQNRDPADVFAAVARLFFGEQAEFVLTERHWSKPLPKIPQEAVTLESDIFGLLQTSSLASVNENMPLTTHPKDGFEMNRSPQADAGKEQEFPKTQHQSLPKSYSYGQFSDGSITESVNFSVLPKPLRVAKQARPLSDVMGGSIGDPADSSLSDKALGTLGYLQAHSSNPQRGDSLKSAVTAIKDSPSTPLSSSLSRSKTILDSSPSGFPLSSNLARHNTSSHTSASAAKKLSVDMSFAVAAARAPGTGGTGETQLERLEKLKAPTRFNSQHSLEEDGSEIFEDCVETEETTGMEEGDSKTPASRHRMEMALN